MGEFTGNFCSCLTYRELQRLNKEYWFEEMLHNSVLVNREEPDDAQCRSWLKTRTVLLSTLKQLPAGWKDVHLVFEYVLPNRKPGTKKAEKENGIRPDVLMVGKNFVAVLEFKQRKLDPDGSVYEGYCMQAQKYVTRLNKYHRESQDKYVAPIVVLTLAKNLLEDRDDIVICSGDKLAEALLTVIGDSPEPCTHQEMEAWLCSKLLNPA